MQYRPEIDGLRALAVVPIMFFHAGFTLFSGGFVGVDIFFVISGYLITSLILSEMDRGEFSLVEFYKRRARRILPILFFVMAICIPFALVILIPHDMQEFSQSLFAVSIFSSNFFFWLESGYFDAAGELKPLLHTWSLAVEEQFYIVFPLALMFLWRFGKTWLLVSFTLGFFIEFECCTLGIILLSISNFLFFTNPWMGIVGRSDNFALWKSRNCGAAN